MTRPVIVVGSYLVGISMRIESFPRPGQTVLAAGTSHGHGGKGSNQAIQAARCGATVRLVGAVGDDDRGAAARALWQAEGVDAAGVETVADLPTGFGCVLVDARGDNQIVVEAGATRRCDGALVGRHARLFDGAAVVLTQGEVPTDAALACLAQGRRAGALTILNPAPVRADLPERLWAAVDILTPNEGEAEALAGKGSIAANGRALAAQVGRAVLITAGANGVFAFFRDGRSAHVPAPLVDVVDTTGAGDAFNGALANGLAETGDLDGATRFAVAAGSLACTRTGTVAAFRARDEIAALADRAATRSTDWGPRH